MNKVLGVLVATIVSFGMSAGIAAADATDCGSINGTGPGSSNTETCDSTNSTTVSCVNGIYVVNDNSQQASSGSSSTTGNTTGGDASTGQATNSNGQTVTIGASCGSPVATTTTTTTIPPTTPTTGGSGAGVTAAVTPVAATVASLPDTGSDAILNSALIGVGAVSGVLAISQLGVLTYRRFVLK